MSRSIWLRHEKFHTATTMKWYFPKLLIWTPLVWTCWKTRSRLYQHRLQRLRPRLTGSTTTTCPDQCHNPFYSTDLEFHGLILKAFLFAKQNKPWQHNLKLLHILVQKLGAYLSKLSGASDCRFSSGYFCTQGNNAICLVEILATKSLSRQHSNR